MSAIRRAADRARGKIDGGDRVVVFDVMGTLFDLSGLDERFAAIGAPPTVRRAWFERLLDSAHTLTLLGEYAPFEELARSTLRTTLAQESLDPDAAEGIAACMPTLSAYDDAGAAVAKLAEAGISAVVLTNGGKKQTQELLANAGLADAIGQIFSTEQVRKYKPDARPYRLVVGELGVAAHRLTMVAAHGWDVLGARAAGLEAIWVDRLEVEWPFPRSEPGQRAADLVGAVALVMDRAAAEL